MSLETQELLSRIAATLRNDIGPEVENEFARTQAFMASVVLQRVAKELELDEGHRSAEQVDMADLQTKLGEHFSRGHQSEVVQAEWAKVLKAGTVKSLSSLIEALHRESGNEGNSQALDLIRPVLRADIDRRMEIAL